MTTSTSSLKGAIETFNQAEDRMEEAEQRGMLSERGGVSLIRCVPKVGAGVPSFQRISVKWRVNQIHVMCFGGPVRPLPLRTDHGRRRCGGNDSLNNPSAIQENEFLSGV